MSLNDLLVVSDNLLDSSLFGWFRSYDSLNSLATSDYQGRALLDLAYKGKKAAV